jgi:hypothetical protein
MVFIPKDTKSSICSGIIGFSYVTSIYRVVKQSEERKQIYISSDKEYD